MTPTPTPTSDLALSTGTLGSPGFIGFVVTFALAVALILLLRSLVTQLRRVEHRAAAQSGAEGLAGPDGRVAGPDGAAHGPDDAPPR